MNFYRGFSTVNSKSQKKFRLVDNELIKQDLLNSLNTRMGTRVMQPKFGCLIWDLLFEPYTDDVKEKIFQNLTDIVNADVRVRLQSINLSSPTDDHVVTAELVLYFLNTNQSDTMQVVFDAQNSQVKPA